MPETPRPQARGIGITIPKGEHTDLYELPPSRQLPEGYIFIQWVDAQGRLVPEAQLPKSVPLATYDPAAVARGEGWTAPRRVPPQGGRRRKTKKRSTRRGMKKRNGVSRSAL